MTTTPDFRALCAELVDQLSAYDGCDDVEEVSQHWNYTNCNELLHRASTALATPPPEPPTIMEILALIDEIDEARLGQIDLVRAALERWGQ